MATSQKSAPAVKRPVHEIRFGRVKAAIWENETSQGVRHNVTFQRIYRDEDSWKTSDSFGRDDLPLVQKVSDLAHTWIYEQSQENSPRNSE
jgi:hypothetical protein